MPNSIRNEVNSAINVIATNENSTETNQEKEKKTLLYLYHQIHKLLKRTELIYPPGVLTCMDFSFYDITSMQGCESVLDIICLSARCLHNFLR